MKDPVILFPTAREFNSETAVGIKTDSTTTGGNVDLYVNHNADTQVFTNNLSAGLVVGLNLEGASPRDRLRICRNSAAPGAFTVIVKSGTAAGGTAIGTLVASTNGFIEAQFDGSAWARIAQAVHP